MKQYSWMSSAAVMIGALRVKIVEVLFFYIKGPATITLYISKQVRGYKTFFRLSSTEHEIFPAHKC